MTVKELIELLKQVNQEKEVICGDNQDDVYAVEEWKNCVYLSTTKDFEYRLVWG